MTEWYLYKLDLFTIYLSIYLFIQQLVYLFMCLLTDVTISLPIHSFIPLLDIYY